jgi:hypothetical protein
VGRWVAHKTTEHHTPEDSTLKSESSWKVIRFISALMDSSVIDLTIFRDETIPERYFGSISGKCDDFYYSNNDLLYRNNSCNFVDVRISKDL